MKKLVSSGLFGAGQIPIDSPTLVSRYNGCLEDIGIPRTSLKTFSIDGMGWSREVAEEREDPFYLSHGLANPFGIVLSPLQYKLPVHFPFHSFDRMMMQFIFDNAMEQIRSLTEYTGLWIDIDQEMEHYRGPDDLLLIDSIVLRFGSVGGLMTTTSEQQAMVHRILHEGNAWADKDLRAQFIASTEKHGDLRGLDLMVNDMPFPATNFQSFYTRAFDGVFVLRELDTKESLLVIEDSSVARSVGTDRDDAIAIKGSKRGKKRLVEELFDQQMIDIDLGWYQAKPNRLHRLKECLFINALCNEYPDVEVTTLTNPQRSKYARKLIRDENLEEDFVLIDHLIKKLEKSDFPDPNDFSHSLRLLLARPHSRLSESTQSVIWKLLMKIQPMDVLSLYVVDKEEFYKQYLDWPEKQEKVVNTAHSGAVRSRDGAITVVIKISNN